MWLTPFGLPSLVVCDRAFFRVFEDLLSKMGVQVWMPSADDHTPIGRIEAHNHSWRLMLHRVVDANGVFTLEELDDAIDMTAHAKNSLVKRCGRSPFQARFGQVPRLPGELLNDQTSTMIYENISQDEALNRQEA